MLMLVAMRTTCTVPTMLALISYARRVFYAHAHLEYHRTDRLYHHLTRLDHHHNHHNHQPQVHNHQQHRHDHQNQHSAILVGLLTRYPFYGKSTGKPDLHFQLELTSNMQHTHYALLVPPEWCYLNGGGYVFVGDSPTPYNGGSTTSDSDIAMRRSCSVASDPAPQPSNSLPLPIQHRPPFVCCLNRTCHNT